MMIILPFHISLTPSQIIQQVIRSHIKKITIDVLWKFDGEEPITSKGDLKYIKLHQYIKGK